MKIYVIGSLRNSNIPVIANILEEHGHEVFADWHSPGPDTDVFWQQYEMTRGRSFLEAIEGPHAKHVFDFDLKWIRWAEAGLLVLPAGKSGHLELGVMLGMGKAGYILLDGEHKRWDVMYRFATGIFPDVDQLVEGLK